MWVVAIGGCSTDFDVGVLLAHTVAVNVTIPDVDGVSWTSDDPLDELDTRLLGHRLSTERVLIGGVGNRATVILLGRFGRTEDHDVADLWRA